MQSPACGRIAGACAQCQLINNFRPMQCLVVPALPFAMPTNQLARQEERRSEGFGFSFLRIVFAPQVERGAAYYGFVIEARFVAQLVVAELMGGRKALNIQGLLRRHQDPGRRIAKVGTE